MSNKYVEATYDNNKRYQYKPFDWNSVIRTQLHFRMHNILERDIDRIIIKIVNTRNTDGELMHVDNMAEYNNIVTYLTDNHSNIRCIYCEYEQQHCSSSQYVLLSFNPEYICTLKTVLNMIPHELIDVINRY